MEKGKAKMAENLHTKEDLRQRQALPLEAKISMTQLRIRQWYNYWYGDVCVSFSGGKDSTVLLHLVRQMYPDVKAIFVNTGLEYPEIQSFVKTFDNVEIVRPAMRFDEVISKYGYPLISKEVAEAIYYARRIRSQTVQVERERERARPSSSKQAEQRTAENNSQRSVPERRSGKSLQTNAKRYEVSGGAAASTDERDGTQTQRLAPGMVQLRTTNEEETRTQRIQSRGERKWADYHRTILNPDPNDPRQAEIVFNRKPTDYHDWRRGCL